MVSTCSFGFYCVVGKKEKRICNKYFFSFIYYYYTSSLLVEYLFSKKIMFIWLILHEKVGKEA